LRRYRELGLVSSNDYIIPTARALYSKVHSRRDRFNTFSPLSTP
jgi:hypothetical protein